MPIEVSYPGVYIEELPSGQHTITPVATNIAAFVGRAPIGPTDEPATIYNFGGFQRMFGGLQFDYPLSYAVQDFFANGGSQAIIARLFEPADGQGDGVARMKFPGAPPVLPDRWQMAADADPGATTVMVAEPTDGSEGEPDTGMIVWLDGDKSTSYLVADYTPGKGDAPGTMTIIPALKRRFRTCTTLSFDHGPSPVGWTASFSNGAKVTLSGGTGIPGLGDTVTFAGNPTRYPIVAEPTVSGRDITSIEVAVVLASAAPAGSYGAVTIDGALPLPMPNDWQIDSFQQGKAASTGTLNLINGRGAPLPGDTFTIGAKPDVYVVTAFTPGNAKAPANVLAFVSVSGDPLVKDAFCHCCTPNFSRDPVSGLTIKAGAKQGGTRFSYTRGAATRGTIDIGDTFTVDGDDAVYSVRYVDATTIYFLPKSKTGFDASTALAFSPTLSLAAASPGEWGNYLTATIDTKGISDATAKPFKADYGLDVVDLFNLTLTQSNKRGKPVKSERYLNLSVRADGVAGTFPNRVDRVLASDSTLARIDQLSGIPPSNGAAAAGAGGNDGAYLSPETYIGDQDSKTGLYMFEHVPMFNLLSIPPDRRILGDVPESEQDLDRAVRQAAASYCTDRRAFYIVDPPVAWKNMAAQGQLSAISPDDVGITGENRAGIEVARNAAVYFPRICKEDVLMKSRQALFAPSGAIAGVMAATDIARGIWKAPAGMDAGVANVTRLEVNLTDDENGQLNQLGINCLRTFPVIGTVVWGSRTLRGADQFEDDYKYIPVRRLTLFIEDSLMRGTQWAVFEPNDEALWSSLRLSVNGFLADLARQGAFYDYAVTCDATTTTQDDIDNGIVNILVQIAPVKPAEFVVLQIQQLAGGKPN